MKTKYKVSAVLLFLFVSAFAIFQNMTSKDGGQQSNFSVPLPNSSQQLSTMALQKIVQTQVDMGQEEQNVTFGLGDTLVEGIGRNNLFEANSEGVYTSYFEISGKPISKWNDRYTASLILDGKTVWTRDFSSKCKKRSLLRVVFSISGKLSLVCKKEGEKTRTVEIGNSISNVLKVTKNRAPNLMLLLDENIKWVNEYTFNQMTPEYLKFLKAKVPVDLRLEFPYDQDQAEDIFVEMQSLSDHRLAVHSLKSSGPLVTPIGIASTSNDTYWLFSPKPPFLTQVANGRPIWADSPNRYRCASETIGSIQCLHPDMPLLRQNDVNLELLVSKKFNKDVTVISNRMRDTGWCVPTSLAMVGRTVAIESGKYFDFQSNWRSPYRPGFNDSADINEVIWGWMVAARTNVIYGGTTDRDANRALLYILSPFISLDYTSLAYDDRIIHRSPIGFMTMCGHANTINGREGKYLKMYDPWGSVYDAELRGGYISYISGAKWQNLSTNCNGIAKIENWLFLNNYMPVGN